MTTPKYTVAVDFDGVIHSYTSGWKDDWMADPINRLDPPVEGAIEWLVEMTKHFEVVIHTTRGQYGAQAEHAVWQWLCHWGWPPDVQRPAFTCRKMPALIYLDDRAVRFEGPGTFPTKEQVHQLIPWNKKERA